MEKRVIDDVCARPNQLGAGKTEPLATPLYATSVWRCESIEQADRLLGGGEVGYIYQRDGHPNADLLAARCCELHGAERGIVAPSGMAALAVALLSQVDPGDRVLLSRQMYGKTLQLFQHEGRRWGLDVQLFDPTAPESCEESLAGKPRLVLVETISNPNLRVVNLGWLAELCRGQGARLLVDNTFATPLLVSPLERGASLVMESLTKMMNGHSDVVLGYLGGEASCWERVAGVQSTWGYSSSPWDCWLAARGLATMHLRVDRACSNARRAAEFLAGHPGVERVDYPGLASHPDHVLAEEQFGGRFGSIVTFHLRGGRSAAQQFLDRAQSIPLAPSLGEISTTVSHPESTSHRGLSPGERAWLGIGPGTLRLSCGIESSDGMLEVLSAGCGAV
jgi:cystathionine beta-lyase/cystathionine gamma-synthase